MTTNSKLTIVSREASQQVRNVSEKSNVDLWAAYKLAGDLIYRLVEFGTREPKNVTDSCSNRVSLTANMVQSFYAAEDLISSGAYWSAAAVLRQHMETLARIIEYRVGKNQIDKKPPNVKYLPFNMAPNYGRLSELCHTSGEEILGDFSESIEGEGIATTIPRFREETAKNYFALHIAHMLALAIEIYFMQEELYPDVDMPNIDEDILNIANLLVKIGFWKEFNDKS